MAVSQQRFEEAVRYLREGLAHWSNANAPLDGAHARLRLTEILAQVGDQEGAKLELAAARAILQRLGVRTSLSRWVDLERKLG